MAATQDVEAQIFTVDVKFPSVKGLLTALQSIKTNTKQVCQVTFDSTGMVLKWEHESKSMQSGIFLSSGLFNDYRVTHKSCFGMPFNTLLDTLAVFASSTPQELRMRFPGPDEVLILEANEGLSEEDSTAAGSSMYARLDTIEMPALAELSDYWEDPVSYFIAPGGILKEVLEDLEWPKGDVTLKLTRDPQKVTFSSGANALSLDIHIPNAMLSGFGCAFPEVHHSYRYKYLSTAFTNIPQKEPAGVSTKVQVDANGLMKVTHMLNLATVHREVQEVSHPLASVETQQRPGGIQRIGVAQIQILPLGEIEDIDPEDPEGVPLY